MNIVGIMFGGVSFGVCDEQTTLTEKFRAAPGNRTSSMPSVAKQQEMDVTSLGMQIVSVRNVLFA